MSHTKRDTIMTLMYRASPETWFTTKRLAAEFGQQAAGYVTPTLCGQIVKGFIERQSFPDWPKHTLYRLTDAGRAFVRNGFRLPSKPLFGVRYKNFVLKKSFSSEAAARTWALNNYKGRDVFTIVALNSRSATP